MSTEYDDHGKDNLEGVVYNGPFITYNLKEVISKKRKDNLSVLVDCT